MTGLLVTVIILVGAGLLLARTATPAYYRRKPAGFVWDMSQRLVQMAEGSIMVIEHEGSQRFFQWPYFKRHLFLPDRLTVGHGHTSTPSDS